MSIARRAGAYTPMGHQSPYPFSGAGTGSCPEQQGAYATYAWPAAPRARPPSGVQRFDGTWHVDAPSPSHGESTQISPSQHPFGMLHIAFSAAQSCFSEVASSDCPLKPSDAAHAAPMPRARTTGYTVKRDIVPVCVQNEIDLTAGRELKYRTSMPIYTFGAAADERACGIRILSTAVCCTRDLNSCS